MTVKQIVTMDQFKSLVESTELVVIDFSATWCGPCQYIAPIFEELAGKHNGSVVFAKVDVDKAKDVAEACKIKCMPTFQFFKGGEKIDELVGASSEKLKQLLAMHANAS